jgi:glucokinase
MQSQTHPALALGVDVGATKILVGTVDRGGRVHRSERYAMDRNSTEAALASLRGAIAGFLADGGTDGIVGVGFGLPGLTDSATGTWVNCTNVPIPSPVPLAAEMMERYGLRAYLDNDVHAATTAEIAFGVGRSARHFIYLNVGTGIAAGVVADGRLIRGALNYAGEAGHMMVEPLGVLCTCGQRGCLEATSSGGGIIAQAKETALADPTSSLYEAATSGRLTSTLVFAAADAGDAVASGVATRALFGLCYGITSLANLLNPEIIVVGGGVFADGWLLPRLQKFVGTYALRNVRRSLRGIVPSELLVDQVGLLGAASLAWEHES